jgi:hypothetical protein
VLTHVAESGLTFGFGGSGLHMGLAAKCRQCSAGGGVLGIAMNADARSAHAAPARAREGFHRLRANLSERSDREKPIQGGVDSSRSFAPERVAGR